MKLFLLVTALSYVATIHPAFALEISSRSLASSVGFLRYEPYPDITTPNAIAVLSEAFESFSIAPSTSAYRQWLTPGREKPFPNTIGEMFFFESDDVHYGSTRKARRYFEDPSTQRVFTVWSDTGYEDKKQVIVVWKRVGEKLKLEAILDYALRAAIGSSGIEEVRPLPRGRIVLIGRTEGGDGGDTWGTVWIALWTEPRHLEILWSMNYSGGWEIQRDLTYEFDRKNLKMDVHRREQRLIKTNGVESRYSEAEVVQSWTLDVGFMVPQ